MHINEATNDLVGKDNKREGRIEVEKHISDSQICQDGKVSSDKLAVMSDDLSSLVMVELNYVGEEDDLNGADKVLVDAPFGAC